MMDEKVWLVQLEKGEEDAFRVLFETYYVRLCSFAFKYIEDHGITEDIVQDVLYELWLKKLHFENLIALRTYLYHMVRNRCLDVLKHRKVEQKFRAEQEYKKESDFFLHQIMEEEVYTLLKEALAALPQQTGRIFELALNGYNNAEIAEIMHLTLDAVKSHKKRGKKILQDRLKGFIYLLILFDSENIPCKK